MTVRLTARNAPTQRSLAYLRARGWTCDIAERKHGPISRDLFGAFDIVGFGPLCKCLLVQTTSKSNFASRVAKVRACPDLASLLACGVAIEVHGWGDEVEPRIERVTA